LEIKSVFKVTKRERGDSGIRSVVNRLYAVGGDREGFSEECMEEQDGSKGILVPGKFIDLFKCIGCVRAILTTFQLSVIVSFLSVN